MVKPKCSKAVCLEIVTSPLAQHRLARPSVRLRDFGASRMALCQVPPVPSLGPALVLVLVMHP